MDTTAAAELGMGGPNGAMAFWHAGPPGPDHWGDPGNTDLLEDAAADNLAWDSLPASAALPDFPASPSGVARARAPTAEPPKLHSHGVPLHPSFSGGSSGHGAGPLLGRGNSSAPAAASPHFAGAAIGSSPLGVGAVGRGRGMGSIFYKTKLCSRFRSGNCPYNTNCNFAHGMEELRKPPPGWEEFVASQELPPPSQSGQAGGSGAAAGSTDSQVRFHKTRPCKKYFGEGNCPYGEKCNFLHDEQSVPRAVREAREAAVAANLGGVVAPPKVETTLVPTTNGHLKDTGGSGSTTSAELQRYLSDPNAPALSDSKSGGTTARDSMAVSWHQRHHAGGASSFARSGSKENSTWRGPNDISTIYGDWWVEDDYWPCGGSTSHESTELEGDVWRERPTPLPAPSSSSTPKTVPFFRRTNSLEPSRQTPESH